jgi:hypothetical protein
MPNIPYKLSPQRVAISPFPTIQKASEALQKYHKNEKIGFTYISSLKSMGLIPRSNGQYILGKKYCSN